MRATKLSSRKFNQEVGRAKKIALKGPVFITDRGAETHVLLNIEEYRQIAGKERSLFDALYDPKLAAIDSDFEFEKIDGDFKPAEFD